MPQFTNQDYLLNEQYKTASNLTQRANLHALFSTATQGWMHWLFDQYDVPNQAKILELGCGPGWLWKENLDRMPEHWDVVLSDFSPGMLSQARENVQGRKFDFEVIDAQQIPFEDETFDAVLANHMMYHVPDRQKAIGEVRRVLKPNGFFYAATNGQAHMRQLRDMVLSVQPRAYDDWSAACFGLENAKDQLTPFFGHVERRDHKNDLRVTQLAPLMDYVASSKRLTDEEMAAVREMAGKVLQDNGEIYIEKSVGVLIARK